MFRPELRLVTLVLSALLALAPHAHASPLPFAATLPLGNPARPVAVAAAGGEALTLTVGGRTQTLPARNATDLTIEAISVGSDAKIALVRVTADNGPWVGVIGGRSGADLLLFDRSEPHGDPGERRKRELDLRGEPKELHTGVQFERVSLCGNRPVLLEPQRLDPVSLTLVRAQPELALGNVVDAAVAPLTGELQAPRLPLLSAVSSSEIDPAMKLPRAPRGLVDGDLDTSFALRPGSFAVMRWTGGALAIERLELELAKGVGRPVELLWLSDGPDALRSTISPATVNASKPVRVTITPPNAIAGRCLALLVPTSATGAGLEIREVRAYSDLDREGGVERLVGALVQDGEPSAEAAARLTQLGDEAAEQVALRWDELSTRGKRRALNIMARSLERSPVRERVRQAVETDDRGLAEAAIAVLLRGGEPGHSLLRELAKVSGDAGELAVIALAQLPEESAQLLAALEIEGGEERPALRKALTMAARRDRARFDALATSWLERKPRVGARISLALAAANAGQRELATLAAEQQPGEAERFEDRFRLALALAQAGEAPMADKWLRGQAEHASEWMQRVTAFDALVRRGAGDLEPLAEVLSRDAYPRVRASVYPALLAAGRRPLVESAAASDPWPLVRVEAVRALARDRASRAALEAALEDSSRHVRRAAIEALDTQAQSEAWPRVSARMSTKGEALEVREAAIAYARHLCLAQARPALSALAQRLSSPDASEDDTRLAVEALRALHDLGGAAAQEGQQIVEKAATPELAKLWSRLPPARCVGAPHS